MSLFALIAGTHQAFQRPLKTNEWRQYFGDEWHLYKHHFVSEAESEPSAEAEATSEPEAASEPEVEPETTSEPEVEPETTSEPEVEPETTSEPENSPKTEEEPLPIPENAFSRYLFLDIIEFTCIALFTLDLLIRVVVCPFRFQLLFSFLNWVDIFALLVMYLKYTIETIYPKEKYEASVLDMLHCLQVVRIFRLFRLVKNFIGFRVLLYAFRASFKELMLMSLFLFVAMVFFSTFAFFSGDNNFPNIPDSFWWAVVTMTTVGYGDVVPKTPLSKTIGVFCAISGVCLIAVIIPIFVNNFMLFYSYSKVWGKKIENQNEHKHVKITQVLAVDDLKA